MVNKEKKNVCMHACTSRISDDDLNFERNEVHRARERKESGGMVYLLSESDARINFHVDLQASLEFLYIDMISRIG